MRYFTLYLIFCSLSILITCSGDDPVSPQSNDTNLLHTQDVGSEGGTVELDNVVIDIPLGAFSSVNAVKIYSTIEKTQLDASLITSRYIIDGFPNTFEQPINIRLKNNSSRIDDTCQIAVGRGGFDPDITDSTKSGYSYDIITVVDSSGWLCYQIPANPAGSFAHKASAEIFTMEHYLITLFGLYPEYTKVNYSHFTIHYVKGPDSDINQTANYLEDALAAITSSGYDLSGMGFPHRAFIRFEDYNDAKIVISKNKESKYIATLYITVNKVSGQDYTDYELKVRSRLYQIIPVLYGLSQYNTNLKWFTYALSTWSEDKFMYPPTHCSKNYTGNQMAPFKGMQAAVYRSFLDPIKHGYGMSTFLKYMVKHHSETILIHALEHMKSFGEHPFNAFEPYISDDRGVWWSDYFKEHILGDPCDFDANEMISSKSGDFIINGANDTLETFKHAFYDLSARAYYIGLNYNEIGDDDFIRITATCDSIYLSDLNILVFSYKDNTLQFIDKGNAVTIENIASYKSAGQNLVAVVVNSNADERYYASRTSEVDLRFQYQKSTAVTFKSVKIRCIIKPEFQYDHGATYWGETLETLWLFNGTSSNGVFTSSEPSEMVHGNTATGTMTVSFNPITFDIISFEADLSYMIDLNNRLDMSISGTTVPHFHSSGWEEARIQGVETCYSITSLGYFNLFDITNYNWVTLKSYDCNTSSLIVVELWD